MICTTLSNAGGLFCVPILVAHSTEDDSKAALAKPALDVLKKRFCTGEVNVLVVFFEPDYWKLVWVGPKENFITYVACLHGWVFNNKPLSGVTMDELGECLIHEIQIDLFP
jgi:hypothetical protein